MAEFQQVTCEGKVQFDSYHLAKNALRHNEKNRVPYRCRCCHKWHLGTRLRRVDKRMMGRLAYE